MSTVQDKLGEARKKEQEFQESTFPCLKCNYQHFCKYRGIVKRFDYPPEVFQFAVTCRYFNPVEEGVVEASEKCW